MFLNRVTSTLLSSSILLIGFATPAKPATKPYSDRVVAQALAAAPRGGESGANVSQYPQQILRTGINLNTTALSPNSKQLADLIKLTPVLERIESLRAQVRALGPTPTLEGLATRQDLSEAVQQAHQIILQTDLAIDYTIAEIGAETTVISEVHATFSDIANKSVTHANWASYYSNGALWAVAEALAIPSWKRPKYAISSGINGIIAGIIPSAASLWAMHTASGPHRLAEKDPNMLTALFDLNPNAEIQYPRQVWDYLGSTPPGQSKARKDVIIDRWIADANLPSFTNRNDKSQVAIVTGNVEKRKGLTIDVLNTRHVMLDQLSSEILKMKRLLYELSMAVNGEKSVQVAEHDIGPGL